MTAVRRLEQGLGSLDDMWRFGAIFVLLAQCSTFVKALRCFPYNQYNQSIQALLTAERQTPPVTSRVIPSHGLRTTTDVCA